MTTPLIEAIAREVRTYARKEVDWQLAATIITHRSEDIAQSALTAITEAGYAVVPVLPDLDTMLGMMTAANEADCGDLTITSARAALAYLIAAQGDG